MVRIAILDLYEGQANQGMRCIRELINLWSEHRSLDVEWDEFDVRLAEQVPDLSYDIYISSGGPGNPWDGVGSAWEAAYFSWLSDVENWNNNPQHTPKKFVFFICHSFQLACRHWNVGEVTKRNSTSFGVFPVHVLLAGQAEPVFTGLRDPFYVVDSRDWQVIDSPDKKINMMGAEVLCVEKWRPHVDRPQALMGMRFNNYMIGTQFHPEADAVGMSMYLQTDEKKKTVIENFGEAKWRSMLEGLSDPEKIMRTYMHILPNFLNGAADHLATAPILQL